MSIFIQEVLGLLNRNQKKITLDKTKDYFEFGKLYQSSSLNNKSGYTPKMDPFVIKWGDLVCQATEDLTKTLPEQGTLGFVPVYTDPSGTCSWNTLKDSLITQNALNTIINVNGSLNVNENVQINGTTQSTNCNTGALIVKGGVGIAKSLNVCAELSVNGTSFLNGKVNLGDALADEIRINGKLLDNLGYTGTSNQLLVSQVDGSALWQNNSTMSSKSFTALISQFNGDEPVPPTMIIMYSDFLSITWTFSYFSTGVYTLQADQPIFTEFKTAVYITPNVNSSKPYCASIERSTDTLLIISSFHANGTPDDNFFNNATFKFEVYQ